jgi:tRNA pseudouridine13 synthase
MVANLSFRDTIQGPNRMDPALPFATPDLPGTGGVLRASEEDFRVEEIPAYEPEGQGEHVFVLIEKRGIDSPGAIRALARALGVNPADVGCAGLKDRNAVTRQRLSFPPPVTPEAALAVAIDRIAVLDARRHPHKLRTGHLRGNRFTLRVREPAVPAEAAAERARSILERLARPPGSPNWFGAQRFGRRGDNAEVGRALVRGDAGRRAPRGRERRFLVSAYQSHLFNEVLRRRLEDQLLGRVIEGDVLARTRSGGLFVSVDPATDQPRLEQGEVIATGPMFGHKMMAPPEGSDAGRREQEVLSAEGIGPETFRPLGKIAAGTRRPLAVMVGAPDVRVAEVAVEVSFDLPAGSYATAVMREVMKTNGTNPEEA